MTMITIKNQSELSKYLKDGSDCVYEFKMLGVFVDVKFKCNIFETRNKILHETGKNGGMVIFKANTIRGKSIIVDRIEADKIVAENITATYIFSKKIVCPTIECMNIEAEEISSKILFALMLQAKKVTAEFVDICELRNCTKMSATKVSMMSMDGGKIKAKSMVFNNKRSEDDYPLTRRRMKQTSQLPSEIKEEVKPKPKIKDKISDK